MSKTAESYEVRNKRRIETRAKLQMILEAADHPMKAEEISKHPTMNGMQRKNIGLFLSRMKGIVFNKKTREWSFKKSNGAHKPNGDKKRRTKRGPYKKVTPSRKVAPSMDQAHFLIKTNGDLYLTVGTVSLPVGIE